MSLSTTVHAAVEASRSSDGVLISEDPGNLHVSGKLSREALEAWQAVWDLSAPWLTATCVDSFGDYIVPSSVHDDEVRINLTFAPSAGAPHLFTEEGWRSLLFDEGALASAVSIFLAFDSVRFETLAFNVAQWVADPIDVEPRSGTSDVNPRRYVRCQATDFMAPRSIAPWMCKVPPVKAGVAWHLWQSVMAVMIARSLPNELYKDVEVTRVILSGQPPRSLDFGSFPKDGPNYDLLQEAAKWVYLEGSDIEVRHTFFSAELAREWPSQLTFCEGITGKAVQGLESAKLLYKAHLRSGSKDTLKSLADLRKTLADEVQKMMQQAKDLSSGVWKDVSIAIGVVAIRLALDSTKIATSAKAFSAIYIVVAIYILVSYYISLATNSRFLEIVNNSRSSWRNKLYGFLEDADYTALAEMPLADAFGAYNATRRQTTIVVCLVVLALTTASLIELEILPVEALLSEIKGIASWLYQWFARSLELLLRC